MQSRSIISERTRHAMRLRMLIIFLSIGVWTSLGKADELGEAFNQYKSLNAQGKYQEALPFAKESVRIGIDTFGEENKTTAILLKELGILYLSLGENNQAETQGGD
jgi:hypothetical protein